MSVTKNRCLIVRFVDVSHCDIKVVEHFIEFLIVEDTTGKGLSDLLLAAIEKLGLNIDDCRGQGYDNSANMKGKHEGAQAHILSANSRAFFTPCGCHNLNLVLGDMAKCSSQAVIFFGVLQRICDICRFTCEIEDFGRHCPLHHCKTAVRHTMGMPPQECKSIAVPNERNKRGPLRCSRRVQGP